MVNVMFKNSLWIWLAIKPKIMVVYLTIYLAFSGAVIAAPSVIERKATPPRQELAEIFNSALQPRKRITQNVNDTHTVRPLSRNGIEAAESLQNARSKFAGSFGAPISCASDIRQSVREQRTSKPSSDSDECDVRCAIYVSLPFWIIMLAIVFAPLFEKPRE